MASTESNEHRADEASAVGPVAGVLAQFESPEALVAAAARVREEGFKRWDAHSPMPVHGIDEAMGIRMTKLPWLVLGAGLTGGAVGLLMQWWTNAVHYPIIISGKPLFSVPANIPVTFEVIVLFSALTAFFGALLLSFLPQFWHMAFASKAFARATSDGFFISVEASDKRFDEASVRRLLDDLGATSVETCHAPVAGQKLPTPLFWGLAAAVLLAPLPPLVVAWVRATPSSQPGIEILQDMDFQPKFKAQTFSTLFLDSRSARPEYPGTIPQGGLTDEHLNRGKVGDEWARTFPEPITLDRATMDRGQERFNIYCATCHGLSGDGNGMVAMRAARRGEANWIPPVQLSAQAIRAQPVGQLYNTITNGIRSMPAYATQIPVQDRWAIVLYLQALQRSQAATADDVPEEVRERLP
jgi:mono/diheme cytochrome c family protein